MTARRLRHGDGFSMRGDLGVTVRSAATGKALKRIQIRNKIVDTGLYVLPRLLAQLTADTLSNYQITQIRVGTGVTPPANTDVALGAEVATITLTDPDRTVTALTPTFELRFLATLGSGVANGSSLSEAGLFCPSNRLFARQIHPAIAKTIALVVDYDWRISFSA